MAQSVRFGGAAWLRRSGFHTTLERLSSRTLSSAYAASNILRENDDPNHTSTTLKSVTSYLQHCLVVIFRRSFRRFGLTRPLLRLSGMASSAMSGARSKVALQRRQHTQLSATTRHSPLARTLSGFVSMAGIGSYFANARAVVIIH